MSSCNIRSLALASLGLIGSLLVPAVEVQASPSPLRIVENPAQFEVFGQLWRSYDVFNDSDAIGPAVDILAFVVTNPEPGTEFLRWSATDLNSEADWDSPMTSFLEGLSWREFFGGADFPGPANGYFMEYEAAGGVLNFSDESQPIRAGESSAGEFWFAGPIASDFLIAAVPAGTSLGGLDASAIAIFTGVASVPEPGAAIQAFGCLATLTAVKRQVGRRHVKRTR